MKTTNNNSSEQQQQERQLIKNFSFFYLPSLLYPNFQEAAAAV